MRDGANRLDTHLAVDIPANTSHFDIRHGPKLPSKPTTLRREELQHGNL
jgi:hypothetical protein